MINVKMHRRIIDTEHSFSLPYEGIFWLINDDLYAFADQVDKSGRFSTTLTHKDMWRTVQDTCFLAKDVDYVYFPRGRVSIIPREIKVNDSDYKIILYDSFIYLDKCINNNEIIDIIKHEFYLYGTECKYIGCDGGITEDHYCCNCCG